MPIEPALQVALAGPPRQSRNGVDTSSVPAAWHDALGSHAHRPRIMIERNIKKLSAEPPQEGRAFALLILAANVAKIIRLPLVAAMLVAREGKG